MKRICFLFLLSAALLGCNHDESIVLRHYSDVKMQTLKVASGDSVLVRGCVISQREVAKCDNAAIAIIRFYDTAGAEIKDPSLPYSTVVNGGYRYLPIGFFNLKFTVPKSAIRAEVGVAHWATNRIKCKLFIKGGEVLVQREPLEGGGVQIVSIWFLMFVATVFLLYFCLPWIQPYVLFVASCVFYAFFGWLSFVFIGASAVSVWIGGLMIGREQNGKGWLLGLVVAFNVGILVLLKYLHPWTSILVPLGISFYSLQAISYAWDVKRGVISAEKNPLKLVLYLMFFPTVMQGPISRYGQLGAQLWARHDYSWDRMQSGLELMLWGFFKKMVIADRAAMLADAVFRPGATMEGFPVLLGVVCYSIQIYTDFSGCVDICRGIAEVLGINLIENFKHPYFATSIKDFWRRWHIALSSWLKDYVYIPLGGNRKGAFRKHLNVLIVFGVSGVWHGVGVNFFIWGLLHGVYQVLDALTDGIRKRIVILCRLDESTFSFRFGQRVWTFALVSFAWIFFRAPTLADAWSVITRMCTFNPWTWTDGSYLKHGLDAKDFDVLVFSLALLVVVSIMQEKFRVRVWLARQMFWFRLAIYLLGIFGTLIFGVYGPGYSSSSFIYMQF